MNISNRQQGFTLIELIVVIVILGILAATALPKFVNFQGDAAQAAVSGVAGAVSSAAAINYSKYQISSGAATRINTATPCDDLVKSTKAGLTGAAWPTGYTPTEGVTCVGAESGSTSTCTVTTTQGATNYTAPATVICTG